jgi:hypothetical protein
MEHAKFPPMTDTRTKSLRNQNPYSTIRRLVRIDPDGE